MTDQFAGIALIANAVGANYNFGETVASVNGTVWNDANADGVIQGAERAMPSIRVYVDVAHTGVYTTTDPSALTDGSGNYTLTNLLAGTYAVAVDTNTLPTGSKATYDFDGTNTANQVTALVVLAGTNVSGVNYGYRYASPTLAVLQAGSFQGTATNGGVWLTWHTLSEVGTAGYLIYQQTEAGSWEPLAYAEAFDTITGGYYSALDEATTAPGVYQYQLAEEQMDGSERVLGNCTVTLGATLRLSIQTAGDKVLVQWTGGTAPYHLFIASTLNAGTGSNAVSQVLSAGAAAALWTEVPLADTTTNAMLLPKSGATGFYRVSSGK